MTDLEQLQSKQTRTFVLVFINFVLFMILFAGLGYVSWQSATLINRLKVNLDKAEQTIVQMQDRFQQMDTDVIVDRLVDSASKQIGESIKEVVQGADVAGPIVAASGKLAVTQEMIEQTSQAIAGINETMKELNNEQIAELVSYQILKGLGDGFRQAAEARKPDLLGDQ